MKMLRKQFEEEKGYPSWNCNDTVIQEYIEWLEDKLGREKCPECGGFETIPVEYFCNDCENYFGH